MLLNLIGSIGSIIKYRLSSQCQLPFHFLRVTIDRENYILETMDRENYLLETPKVT